MKNAHTISKEHQNSRFMLQELNSKYRTVFIRTGQHALEAHDNGKKYDIMDLPVGSVIYDVLRIDSRNYSGIEKGSPGLITTPWTIVDKKQVIANKKAITLLTLGGLRETPYERYIENFEADSRVGQRRYSEAGTLPVIYGVAKDIQYNYLQYCSPLFRTKIITNNLDISEEQGNTSKYPTKMYIPGLSELLAEHSKPAWPDFINYWDNLIDDTTDAILEEAIIEAHEAALNYPGTKYQNYVMPYFYQEYEDEPGDILYTEHYKYIEAAEGTWVRDWNSGDTHYSQLMYNMEGYKDRTTRTNQYIDVMAVTNISADTKVYKHNNNYTFIPIYPTIADKEV